MTKKELQEIVENIVIDTIRLKDKYTNQVDARVHYVCIFSQSEEEYEEFLITVKLFGEILEETSTGPIFKIKPIETEAGNLKILKIRKKDITRPERGDADFAAVDYQKLKTEILGKSWFKLIPRESYEMIELMDPDFNVRVYFSNPPVEDQFNLV